MRQHGAPPATIPIYVVPAASATLLRRNDADYAGGPFHSPPRPGKSRLPADGRRAGNF
jgi:hypothetical protein